MIQGLRSYLFGTLRGRLIVGVALVHAVMMSVFITDLTLRQRRTVLDHQRETAQVMSHLLAISAAEWIAADDVSGLQELVEAQRRNPELLFAVLVDANGRVLAATDRERLGQYMVDLPDTAGQTVLSTTPGLVDVATSSMIGTHLVGWARVGVGQKAAARDLASIMKDGIAYTVSAILIGSLIAWFMGRRFTRRLYAIQTTINEIRIGNRLARAPADGTDEASMMAREFNSMLDAAAEQDDQLRLSNERLQVELSERRRAELRLVQLATIVESSDDAIISTDCDGLITSWNRGAERIYGYRESEVLGRPETMLAPPGLAGEMAALLERTKRDEHLPPLETVRRRKDGVEIHVSLALAPIRDAEGRVIGASAIGRDITARKATEEERNRLATAIEQAAETIVITDTSGTIQYVNPAFERVTGYTRREAIGQNPRLVKSDRQDPEYIRAMWATLVRGEVWTGHFTNRTKDGRLYEEEAVISPIRSADGVITNFVAVNRDVTRELQLEEQFRQSQKMEAIGRLAGGVAHDFNNMLELIIGYADLGLDDVAETDPLHEFLVQIRQAGERSANLTRQLLAFARKQAATPRVLDLNRTIEGMLTMLRHLIGEDIEMDWRPDPGIWPVRIDPSQMDQILANHCVNARDAIAGVGRVTIETGMATYSNEHCSLHPDCAPGRFVVLTVADNGSGMDEATVAKIFEPFFTTKEAGRGTGLGLATVYGIVSQNGGFIQVSSEPGRGTTFRIHLPGHESRVLPEAADRVPAPAGGGRETILVVEDEPAILGMMGHMLDLLGYRALLAATPGEAIRLAAEHPGQVALLVTDVVLPEMNGRELAAELASRWPGLRTLFMSGYTGNVLASHGVMQEGVQLLQKPFSKQDLAHKVRSLLDLPPGPPPGTITPLRG
jgi:PAS domain S-box-containing protein